MFDILMESQNRRADRIHILFLFFFCSNDCQLFEFIFPIFITFQFRWYSTSSHFFSSVRFLAIEWRWSFFVSRHHCRFVAVFQPDQKNIFLFIGNQLINGEEDIE